MVVSYEDDYGSRFGSWRAVVYTVAVVLIVMVFVMVGNRAINNNFGGALLVLSSHHDIASEFVLMRDGESGVSSLSELGEVIKDPDYGNVFLTVPEDREGVIITVVNMREKWGRGELTHRELLALHELDYLEAEGKGDFSSILVSFGGVLPVGFEGSIKVEP